MSVITVTDVKIMLSRPQTFMETEKNNLELIVHAGAKHTQT